MDYCSFHFIPFFYLSEFDPSGHTNLHFADCSDDVFALCLQGANVAKAVRLWLQTLKWPSNVDQPDPSDWGMSWFELAVSFYLYTGFRFPLKVGGAGNKSRY